MVSEGAEYSDPLVTLYLGDCLDVMAELPAASVDAVVTDPPYGIEFMGKKWDAAKPAGFDKRTRDTAGAVSDAYARLLDRGPSNYIAGSPFQEWCQQWGTEALRVTKPGGYLLAFGGTRTHHRLVCGLEDAGWIIRDELDWIYASGFPKGKANLKPAHEPIVLARKPGPLRPLGIDAGRIGTMKDWPVSPSESRATYGTFNGRDKEKQKWTELAVDVSPEAIAEDATEESTGPVLDAPVTETSSPSSSDAGRWPSNVLLSDPELFDEPNSGIVGSGATASTGGLPTEQRGTGGIWHEGNGVPAGPQYGDSGGYSRFFRIPRTEWKHSDECAFSRDLMAATTMEEATAAERGQCDCGFDRAEDGLTDYPTAFLIPKADRAERERGLAGAPVAGGGSYGHKRCANCGKQEVNVPGSACECEFPLWVSAAEWHAGKVYCNCKTVKPERWERQDRNQPAPTATTSRARGTSGATTKADSDSSMTLFGSSTSEPLPQDTRSTTSTGTSSTTESRTSSPSIASPTSDFTPGASSWTASGGNDAQSAPPTDPLTSSGGTSQRKAGRSTVDADPATSSESSTISNCADCGRVVKPHSGSPTEAGDGVAGARRNSHPT